MAAHLSSEQAATSRAEAMRQAAAAAKDASRQAAEREALRAEARLELRRAIEERKQAVRGRGVGRRAVACVL